MLDKGSSSVSLNNIGLIARHGVHLYRLNIWRLVRCIGFKNPKIHYVRKSIQKALWFKMSANCIIFEPAFTISYFLPSSRVIGSKLSGSLADGQSTESCERTM